MFQLVKKLAIDSVKLEYPMGGLFPARQVGLSVGPHVFLRFFVKMGRR